MAWGSGAGVSWKTEHCVKKKKVQRFKKCGHPGVLKARRGSLPVPFLLPPGFPVWRQALASISLLSEMLTGTFPPILTLEKGPYPYDLSEAFLSWSVQKEIQVSGVAQSGRGPCGCVAGPWEAPALGSPLGESGGGLLGEG